MYSLILEHRESWTRAIDIRSSNTDCFFFPVFDYRFIMNFVFACQKIKYSMQSYFTTRVYTMMIRICEEWKGANDYCNGIDSMQVWWVDNKRRRRNCHRPMMKEMHPRYGRLFNYRHFLVLNPCFVFTVERWVSRKIFFNCERLAWQISPVFFH